MDTDQFSSQTARKVGEWLVYIAIALLPIFSLPVTALPVALNKSYLAYFLLVPAAILYLVYALKQGKVELPRTPLYLFLLAFVIIAGVSGVFSSARVSSFFGIGHEPHTVSALALFALALIFSSLLLNSEKKWKLASWFLYGSFLVLFLFQLGTLIKGGPFFSWLGEGASANLFGSWNELAVFAGFIAIFSLLNFGSVPRGLFKVASGVVMAAALLMVGFINFEIVWWVIGSFLLVYLSYLYSRHRQPQMFLSVPFFVLLIATFAVFSSALIVEGLSRAGINFLEVRPAWQATGAVMLEVFKHRPVLGSGPNTFLYDWLLYRPASITSTDFWQTRFSSGVGLLATWAVGMGIAGLIALVLFLLWYLWSGFSALMWEEEGSFLVPSMFFGSLYLWTFAAVYPVGFTMAVFTFLMTGMFISAAAASGSIKRINLSLFEKSGVGFLSALLIIFLVILSASWLYVLSKKYAGAYFYDEGAKATMRGNYDRAASLFETALKLDRQDYYYRAFTDLDLIKLSQLVVRRDLPQEKLRTELQSGLSMLIEHAQQAKDANPADPLNWTNLGRAYESIVPLGVQEAGDFAKNAYQEALARFPEDAASLLASARVELSLQKKDAAKEFLAKAIEIKNDYAEAHFLLAQIEAQSGDIDKAIKSSETAALLLPNNVGSLFQLGLLYYQKQNFDDARIVLERTVQLNENYSNARYFLGLMYARAGEKERALAEFRKIAELNPGTEEVMRIITNLEEGREPLADISPPAPQPEKRPKPPVEEKKAGE